MDRSLPDQYNTTYQYPTMLKRFQSNFIDRIITYSLIAAFVYVAIAIDNNNLALRIGAIFIALSYEPLMLSWGGRTIGQRIMGIKVKQLSIDERIPLLNAYAHFALRMMLGWFTFISIHTNNERRALHDIATNAVVVEL